MLFLPDNLTIILERKLTQMHSPEVIKKAFASLGPFGVAYSTLSVETPKLGSHNWEPCNWVTFFERNRSKSRPVATNNAVSFSIG
jgi:hypothetical protein